MAADGERIAGDATAWRAYVLDVAGPAATPFRDLLAWPWDELLLVRHELRSRS